MKSPATLLLMGGDGIGPDVIAAAEQVARWLIAHRRLPLALVHAPFGAQVLAETGHLIGTETLAAIRAADAVLFGAIGDPAYDCLPLAQVRDEGLLRIRRELGVYANLRPVRAWPALAALCPLKTERVAGSDLLIVRELAGGLYYAEPRGIAVDAQGARVATNTQRYSEHEIRRLARVAFTLARQRRGRVCSVDKANVLETGLLWRETVQACRDAEYPDVALAHMLVDTCALQLCRQPADFDVLLTDNLFGDILSDAAGAIAGSLGLLPSASLAQPSLDGASRGLYEPVHGSAPDIAGCGIANPLAAILSLALALRWSLGCPKEAALLERAVELALKNGARTRDLVLGAHSPTLTTQAMTEAVLAALAALSP